MESGTVVTHLWGTFDLLGFQVILESFDALILKWHVPRKLLQVEQNGVKYGVSMTL